MACNCPPETDFNGKFWFDFIVFAYFRQQSLGEIFDTSQLLSFHSPEFDELQHLSQLLYGPDDIEYTVHLQTIASNADNVLAIAARICTSFR